MNEALNEFLKTADPMCAEHDSIVDQLEVVTADRDIKAANLQLLVEKVLELDALRDARPDLGSDDERRRWTDDYTNTQAALFNLARSLKQ